MRVVSLVPSLTETAIELGLGPDELVGRTAFCIEPASRVAAIKVVGGTKTPSLRRVLALAPDVVLLDRDENRLEDARALEAAGVRLFDVDVRGPESVPEILRAVGATIGREAEGERAANALAQALADAAARPRLAPAPRAAILVWRDPWIAVGPDRYAAGMLRALGCEVPTLGEGRYPRVTLDALAENGVDLVWLPEEPFAFDAAHADDVRRGVGAHSGTSPVCVLGHGQDLLWYGARTLGALTRLGRALERARR